MFSLGLSLLLHPEVNTGPVVVRLSVLYPPWIHGTEILFFLINESECTERGGPSITWCPREPSVVPVFPTIVHLLPLALS